MSLQTGKMCPEHPDTEMLYNGNKSRMNCPRRDCTFDVPVTAGTIKALEPQAEVSILHIPTMTILSEQVEPPVFTKKKKDPAVASPVVELRTVMLVNPLSQETPLTLNTPAMPREGYPDRNNERAGELQKHQDALAEAELKRQERKAAAKREARAAEHERKVAEHIAMERDESKSNDLASARVRASSGDRPMSAFERAQHAFIDGPIATLGEAFVALYLSTRKHNGVEAAAALEACRAAFDACNLELADVEVRAGIKAVVGGAEPKLTKHVAAKARVSSKRAGRKAAAKGKKR